jgi:hypothetical protein
MPLIVEDGTGKPDAQAYTDVDFADAYFIARGITTWTGDDEKKEAALISGTEYIDIRWGSSLKGSLEFPETQALLFPRTGVVDGQGRELIGIPDILKRATCEYAIVALTKSLLNSSIADNSGKVVIEESSETGPIKNSTRYQLTGSASGAVEVNTNYPKADSLMAGFLKSTKKQAVAYV